MTISTLLMVLALTIGAGTSQSIAPDSTSDENVRPPTKIGGNCYINGVWYNPCPEAPDPAPEPSPILQQ